MNTPTNCQNLHLHPSTKILLMSSFGTRYEALGSVRVTSLILKVSTGSFCSFESVALYGHLSIYPVISKTT